MEAVLSVDREACNVAAKLSRFEEREGRAVAEAAENLRRARAELVGDGSGPVSEESRARLLSLLAALREATARYSAAHRDLHSSVSKVGKAVDRHFVTDYDCTSREDVFAGREQQRMLNQVVMQHFYRQGKLDLSDVLAEEAGLGDVQMCKEPFKELNAILESISRRELGPALSWAARHRQALDERAGHYVIAHHRGGGAAGPARPDSVEQRSSLEFQLHQMRFVQLLKKRDGGAVEAVAYARRHFGRFVETHEREIQSLMGAVMFAASSSSSANGDGGDEEERLRTLLRSPYAHLLDDTHWHHIAEHFARDACSLMGLSVESPLSVVVNAGCTAIPALLNIKQVMQQRQVSGVWNAKEELPIEIDLGAECRYHSIFACPILRQQTTEANPPLRLTCGHCISRDALAKLSAGHKLKCPYCPIEQNPADARQITF